jgi:hypothetical protein
MRTKTGHSALPFSDWLAVSYNDSGTLRSQRLIVVSTVIKRFGVFFIALCCLFIGFFNGPYLFLGESQGNRNRSPTE